MMHHPPPMTPFQAGPQREKYGVFLEKLPAFITDEILYSQCKKLKLEGITFVKVPREYNSKVSQGYAFIHFDTLESACQARKQFNSQGIYRDEVRAALLVDKPKESSENNFIITDIPLDVKIGQLDEELSKFGTVVSSRIAVKNDKVTSKGIGYVRFYKTEDAQKFKVAAENKEVKFNETAINAMVFKQNTNQTSERQNLFFKDFKKTYTREQIDNHEFISKERENILSVLNGKLAPFGEIASSIVTFNENLCKPFAFVCFKNTDDATKALDEVNKDEEFPFSYRNWALSKVQMQKERKNCKKFLYIKYLKPTVTQEKLYKVLNEILKVTSVQVRTPALASIKTKYATIMTEEENKKEFLFNTLNDKKPQFFNKDFWELFDKKVYVNYLYPMQQHKRWMKQNLGRRFQTNKMNPNAPSMQFNQQHFMMMQFMQIQQMKMMQNQQMPPMQMPPPGMQQPNPAMGFPQQPINYPPPGLAPPHQMNNRIGQQYPNKPYNNNKRYDNRQQQPRRQQQDRNQYQNQNQGQNQNQQQQQRGRQNQQPRQQQYQPKAVQPKPVAEKQQQAQKAVTIESIKGKWDEFLKLPKDRQQHMFGVLFYPKIQKYAKNSAQVAKITGILTDLSSLEADEVRDMYEDEEEFVERVREAEELLDEEAQE